MNSGPQTVSIGEQPAVGSHHPYARPMDNQVHPEGSRAPVPGDAPSCPCSVDFKGNVTCGSVSLFILCVFCIMGYVGTMVMGAVLYDTCLYNTLSIYLIIGSIACMLFVLVFAVWLCNRCFGTYTMVVITVLSLTALFFGSIAGTFMIAFGDCDLLTKYVAIGFSCPVWLVVLLVFAFIIYRNYFCVEDWSGKIHCEEDPRDCFCPCCDCDAGVERLDSWLE